MSGRVCILTTAHPIDDVRVYSKVARSFLDRGYAVSWIGPDRILFAREEWRDPRIDYYLTRGFASKRGRFLSAIGVWRRVRLAPRADWYFSPDPDAAFLAARISRRRRAKLIFDVHEIYHGPMLDRWIPRAMSRPVRALVRRIVAVAGRRADLLIGVSDSVLRPLQPSRGRSLIVRNCAPRWFGEMSVGVMGREQGDTGMVYMHGKAVATNGTPVVLDALRILRSQSVDDVRIIMFSVGNDGKRFMPTFQDLVEERGIGDGLDALPVIGHRDMPQVLSGCDVGLIAYGRDLGVDSLPNRLFEYMATGLAILAPTYSAEMAEIVESERIGITVDFEEPDQVAAAIKWMQENRGEVAEMGERARTAFFQRYNWESEFARLIEAMEQVSIGDR